MKKILFVFAIATMFVACNNVQNCKEATSEVLEDSITVVEDSIDEPVDPEISDTIAITE